MVFILRKRTIFYEDGSIAILDDYKEIDSISMPGYFSYSYGQADAGYTPLIFSADGK